jgi:hypothetical protein
MPWLIFIPSLPLGQKTVAFDRREEKRTRTSISPADAAGIAPGGALETVAPPVRKTRTTKEKPANWTCKLALAFCFFGPVGLSPKAGAPGDDGAGAAAVQPSRQEMREAKKAAQKAREKSTSSSSSTGGGVSGPGSNGGKPPQQMQLLTAQGEVIASNMAKATKLMEDESSLSEANLAVSLIENQLRNPYLSEPDKQSLWKEHSTASSAVRAIIKKRAADRDAIQNRPAAVAQIAVAAATTEVDSEEDAEEDAGAEDADDNGDSDI